MESLVKILVFQKKAFIEIDIHFQFLYRFKKRFWTSAKFFNKPVHGNDSP